MKKAILSLLVVFITLTAILLTQTAMAQIVWEKTNGPSGGYIHEVFAGPNGVVFTTVGSMTYRSLDSGNSWHRMDNIDVFQIVAGIDDNGVVYTRDQTTLYRSTDNGETFSAVFSEVEEAYLTLLDGPGDILYFYGDMFIMSVDNGLSWTVVNPEPSYYMDINSQGHLIKSEGSQLYTSVDNGNTWSLFADLSPELQYISSIAINAADEIFLASYETGIYRLSADGTDLQLLSDLFYYITDIEIAPNGTIFTTSYLGVLWMSTDNGETWQGSNQGMASNSTGYIEIDPSGIVYLSWHDGIYRSENNGVSWVPANEGIYHSSVMSIVTTPDEAVFAATTKIVWKTDNQGENWRNVFQTNDYTDISTLYELGDGSVYVVTFDNYIDKSALVPCHDYSCMHLYRSVDGGESWSLLLDAADLGNLFRDAQGMLTILSSGNLMKSTDNGTSWNEILSDIHLYNVVIDSAGDMYANAFDGFYTSSDNGNTWNLTSPPIEDQLFLDLQISSTGTLFSFSQLNTGGEFLKLLTRSTDGGVNWTSISPPGDPSIFAIYIGLHDYLYIATTSGIYRSADNGDTWANIGPDYTYSFAIAEDDNGILYISSSADGVHKSETYVPASNLVAETSVIEIYPNPATDRITIRYQQNALPANYRIYNLQGKLILTGTLQSPHTSIDVSPLLPGLYNIETKGSSSKFIIR